MFGREPAVILEHFRASSPSALALVCTLIQHRLEQSWLRQQRFWRWW